MQEKLEKSKIYMILEIERRKILLNPLPTPRFQQDKRY